ncbi:alginate lyase [Mucilaginibacter gracilis]|uniref:Alginate lyase n=1 Tax=Mucilaginibacter gracilis TaxID=423350 RepID=A0A495J3Z3_9SPHI|nr:alginate lyase family protein [Mucilaginibacter gracilis]RKR83705.1 alginate lyase [Mucilaginibacter gracilis]
MKLKFFFGILSVFSIHFAFAQSPKFILLDPARLSSKKASYKQGESAVVKQVQLVIKAADKLLDDKPASVMEKAFTPPSGSKHDYMSMAPYFWPDPNKADGLPYIRRDGEHNPEIKKITDDDFLNEMVSKCKFLSLAYYFTGDEKYANKASQLIKVWFIDSETRMNPNLNYAQAIRGVNDGRGIGIIESRCLCNLVDWMALLKGSRLFTFEGGVKAWYKDYLNWLLTSKNGIDEHNAKNNHGTHYDTQVISYALYLGDTALAKKTLEADKKRIALQIEPDGRQMLELERTNALGYSSMNLIGWSNIATLAGKINVDIWNYTTTDGRSLHKAFNWLAPYALGEKPWTEYKQISPFKKDDFYQLLVVASNKYGEVDYIKKSTSIKKNDKIQLTDLLYN